MLTLLGSLPMAAAYRIPSRRSDPTVSSNAIGKPGPRREPSRPTSIPRSAERWACTPMASPTTATCGRPPLRRLFPPVGPPRAPETAVQIRPEAVQLGLEHRPWRADRGSTGPVAPTRLIDHYSRVAAVNSYKRTYRRSPSSGWKRADQTVRMGRAVGLHPRDVPIWSHEWSLSQLPVLHGWPMRRDWQTRQGLSVAPAHQGRGCHRSSGRRDQRVSSWMRRGGALVTSPSADSTSHLATLGQGGASGITLRCGRGTASTGPRSVTLSYMPEPTVVKSVRLPRSLLDGLATRAELECRTFNNLVIKILTEALDDSDPASPAPQDKDKPA